MIKFLSLIIPCVFLLFQGANAEALSSDPKFTINRDGLIELTPAGSRFVETVAKKQITGTLKKIKRKEAYDWMDKFVKLSNRKAVEREDFTPINNLYNHLMMCDDLLVDLYVQAGEDPNAPLREMEKIPEQRKKMLMKHLAELKDKLRADTTTLVSPRSQRSFLIIVDYYDKALRETLEIN